MRLIVSLTIAGWVGALVSGLFGLDPYLGVATGYGAWLLNDVYYLRRAGL